MTEALRRGAKKRLVAFIETTSLDRKIDPRTPWMSIAPADEREKLYSATKLKEWKPIIIPGVNFVGKCGLGYYDAHGNYHGSGGNSAVGEGRH